MNQSLRTRNRRCWSWRRERIGGADAGNRRTSPTATARTRAPTSRRWSSSSTNPSAWLFASASTRRTHLSATGRTKAFERSDWSSRKTVGRGWDSKLVIHPDLPIALWVSRASPELLARFSSRAEQHDTFTPRAVLALVVQQTKHLWLDLSVAASNRI